MASNINANNVDGTYPIAGQDNDSQGFRDNFTNIKNNFTNAKSEIEDLQSKAVLKSALTGETLDNAGGGSVLSDFELKDMSGTRIAKGTTSGTVTLNYAEGPYQTATSSGSITLAFSNFPAYIFEFTTDDQGTTVVVNDLSRSRVKSDVRTPANTGQSGDVAGFVAVDSNYIYVCTGTFDGSTVIWKRAAISAY